MEQCVADVGEIVFQQQINGHEVLRRKRDTLQRALGRINLGAFRVYELPALAKIMDDTDILVTTSAKDIELIWQRAKELELVKDQEPQHIPD